MFSRHFAGLGRSSRICLMAILSVAIAASAVASSTQPTRSGAGSTAPIGSISGKPLAESDIVAGDTRDFDQLEADHESKRNQVELEYAKARHGLLKRELDKRLDREALEREAKARGVAPEAVLADMKVTPPTEEESKAFYDQNKGRINQPYQLVEPKVKEYLTAQRKKEAERAFYDALRARHDIRSLLEPYRVAVAATGPARGQSSAKVTIVEFGDFQCPFCKASEQSLKTLSAQYPEDLRVVFRNLPLTKLHPNALVAAEAGICADRQGKFWEMHDAMYDDQGALDPDGLKATAAKLGLDPERFGACLGDGSANSSLDEDARAARALGLEGTPYFFINGRPVDGDVPLATFEAIVKEELARDRRDSDRDRHQGE